MSTATITALAYLLAEATATGLTIHQTLAQAQATGVVPKEKWDELQAAFDDGLKFWGNPDVGGN